MLPSDRADIPSNDESDIARLKGAEHGHAREHKACKHEVAYDLPDFFPERTSGVHTQTTADNIRRRRRYISMIDGSW